MSVRCITGGVSNKALWLFRQNDMRQSGEFAIFPVWRDGSRHVGGLPSTSHLFTGNVHCHKFYLLSFLSCDSSIPFFNVKMCDVNHIILSLSFCRWRTFVRHRRKKRSLLEEWLKAGHISDWMRCRKSFLLHQISTKTAAGRLPFCFGSRIASVFLLLARYWRLCRACVQLHLTIGVFHQRQRIARGLRIRQLRSIPSYPVLRPQPMRRARYSTCDGIFIFRQTVFRIPARLVASVVYYIRIAFAYQFRKVIERRPRMLRDRDRCDRR